METVTNSGTPTVNIYNPGTPISFAEFDANQDIYDIQGLLSEHNAEKRKNMILANGQKIIYVLSYRQLDNKLVIGAYASDANGKLDMWDIVKSTPLNPSHTEAL